MEKKPLQVVHGKQNFQAIRRVLTPSIGACYTDPLPIVFISWSEK